MHDAPCKRVVANTLQGGTVATLETARDVSLMIDVRYSIRKMIRLKQESATAKLTKMMAKRDARLELPKERSGLSFSHLNGR